MPVADSRVTGSGKLFASPSRFGPWYPARCTRPSSPTTVMPTKCPSKSRSQLSRILSNTGLVSAIELEMAPSTSPEAFCCSSASFVSLNRRTFSIAIAA